MTGACLLAVASSAQESPRIDWKLGPAAIQICDDARIAIPSPLLYIQHAEASRFLVATGNPPTDRELAVVASPSLDWFAVFSLRTYKELGFSVERPSAEEIARSILAGSAAANSERATSGRETLDVTGWGERPHIDAQSRRLEWSLHTQESGGRAVSNRFVYFVTRSGILEVELVTEEGNAAGSRREFELMLTGLRVEKGGDLSWWVAGAFLLIAAAAGWFFLWGRRRSVAA